MIIAVDLDDTLADTMTALVKFHNERYGTSLRKNQIEALDYTAIWQCSEEEISKRFREFCLADEGLNVEVFHGAREGLHRLKEKNDLLLVTARSEDMVAEPTNWWIDRHMPELFKGVYFVNNLSHKVFYGKKSVVCQNLGVELLVDDSLEHAADCTACGIDVLLFDQPWNQGELPNRATRVFSWPEIVEKIEKRQLAFDR